MSINRSEIRKSALSLIYALLENSNGESFDLDLFWDIAQEKKRDHYNEAHAKAVLHVCRASADSARLLNERAEALENAMHGDLTSAALREEVEHFVRRSAAFESAIAALNYCLHDKRREGTHQLALCTRDTLQLAAALTAMGEDLLPRFADFPAYVNYTEAMAAIIRRRGKLTAAVSELAEPANLRDSKEFAGLARMAGDLCELCPAVEELAFGVIEHRAELETELDSLINNYTMERLDLVDRVILLIALYELRVSKLETAIVISEANLLAHTYSGSKSAPFIHGILAAAAKA